MKMSIGSGQIIDKKYRLERELSAGGMGQIWRATHLMLGTEIAVKFISLDLMMGKDSRERGEVERRFRDEAKLAAQIKNPHVVHVSDFGIHLGSPYIVMELLDGEDLGDRLRRVGRMPLDEVAEIVRQASKGLRAAHMLGIVHRDIKPANIHLSGVSDDLHVKLLDFGVAKRALGPKGKQTGSIVGTPAYMSPEALKARGIDDRVDVWALCVTTFEALTGSQPFVGDTVPETHLAIFTHTFKRATELNPSLPPKIDAIFEKAFAKKIDDRFASVRDFVTELSALRAGASAGIARAISHPGSAEDPLIEEGEVDSIDLSSPHSVPLPEPTEVSAAGPSPKGRSKSPSHGDLTSFSPAIGLDRATPTAHKLIGEAEAALGRSELVRASDLAADALGHCSHASNVAGRARLVLAIAASWLGNHENAQSAAAAALDIFSRGSPAWYTALGYLALADSQMGSLHELKHHLSVLRAAESPEAVSVAHLIAACRVYIALVRVGELGPAQALYDNTLQRAAKQSITEPFAAGWLAVAGAECALHYGYVDSYRQYVNYSIDAFTRAGDERSACLQRVNKGNVYMQFGAFAEAEAALRGALVVAEPLELGLVTAVKANLGIVLARLGKVSEGESMVRAAIQKCDQNNHKRFACISRLYLGLIRQMQGDHGAAKVALKEAITLSKHFPAIQAHAKAALADTRLSTGRAEDAMRLAEEAMATLRRLGGVEEAEALIRVVYAASLDALGRGEEAYSSICEARERLLGRADRIRAANFQRIFLERVPENARTIRCWMQWTLADQAR